MPARLAALLGEYKCHNFPVPTHSKWGAPQPACVWWCSPVVAAAVAEDGKPAGAMLEEANPLAERWSCRAAAISSLTNWQMASMGGETETSEGPTSESLMLLKDAHEKLMIAANVAVN